MSFRGVSLCNVDAKGRFAVPTKYRAVLRDMSMSKCVVTIDTDDDCLLLYPLAVWEEIESKLQALPSLNPRVRRVQRLLIGHASEVDLDSQGRLLLPNILRDHAVVDKKLMLVGQGKKFEIWSESNWQRHRQLWLDEGKAMRESQEEVPSELSDISV
ncbi:MAG: division/cell wall cluster transcriptional repressor MraZ [Pseudomonadota bacterium]|nr:division/cell wall cluster transcriptional repressor MraZ [Pseudomonadota bacterium]